MKFKRMLLGVACGIGYGFSFSFYFVPAHGLGKVALGFVMLFLNTFSLIGLREAFSK